MQPKYAVLYEARGDFGQSNNMKILLERTVGLDWEQKRDVLCTIFRLGPLVRLCKVLYLRILLINSVFGQLSAFHRNIVPRARHFENVVYLKPIHKTPVLNRGSIFPAGEFFNRICA